MFDTLNKTTLITGGLSGMGLEFAKQAASRGNHVILVQRRAIEATNEELLELGASSCLQLSYDLSTSTNINALASDLINRNISVDILINNAGVLTGGLLEDQTSEEIEKLIHINLLAPMLLSRKLIPSMVARRSGRIVNNCSVTAKIPIPSASTYGASKAGLLHFTNCLRQELKGTGVSAIALVTPAVKTDMFDDIEVRYGKHMDTDKITPIPAEQWAKKVWKAIENDQYVVETNGAQRLATFISQHFPQIIEGQFGRFFQR